MMGGTNTLGWIIRIRLIFINCQGNLRPFACVEDAWTFVCIVRRKKKIFDSRLDQPGGGEHKIKMSDMTYRENVCSIEDETAVERACIFSFLKNQLVCFLSVNLFGPCKKKMR